MIFLIEYDRDKGQLITFKKFNESERHEADDSRLELELELNRLGKEHEVVVLEAASEEVVRGTHRRYFEKLG